MPITLAPIPKPTPTRETVENRLRAHVYAFRIRVSECFSDFDKLRSGYVTESQFRRGVAGLIQKSSGTPLSEDEFKALVNTYSRSKQDGRCKWTSFVESIDRVFGPVKLESSPTQYVPHPLEIVKPVRPLSPNSEKALQETLQKVRSYVKHHGSDVKSWFRDFDKHNNGYITMPQFQRGFPPNLLSQKEQNLLVSQYDDELTKTVNYFRLNADVNRKTPRNNGSQNPTLIAKRQDPDHHVPIGTEGLFEKLERKETNTNPTLAEVERLVRKNVTRNRIRLVDQFRDYDRLNQGLVSEAKFLTALTSVTEPLSSEIRPDGERVLVNQYKTADGRVNYWDFCKSIQPEFTNLDALEKNPLMEIPLENLDSNTVLSAAEENQIQEITQKLAVEIKKRRLLLAPLFEDFAKPLGNFGRVTRSHFSRILSMFNLNVTEDELHLLFKKFEDKDCGGIGKVNYMQFLKKIDPETYGNSTPKSVTDDSQKVNQEKQSSAPKTVSIDEVMERVVHHVYSKRIRVSECFHDFDKLRCYSISRNEFLRGIAALGLVLSPVEMEALANKYADAEKRGCCKWRAFEHDVETALNPRNLESQPEASFLPKIKISNPFGTPSHVSKDEQQLLDATLDKIRDHLNVRRCNIKPFLKDFDKLGSAHVTYSQFRQCMTYIQLPLSDAEFRVLCKRFSNSSKYGLKGTDNQVCYPLFLAEIENTPGQIGQEVQAPQPEAVVAPIPAKKQVDLQKCLLMMKTKVKKERIRVIDFIQDFDRLRHGRVSKNEFGRCIKLHFANLTLDEIEAISKAYAHPSEPNTVNYIAFCDELESVFTIKGLEKNPTLEPPKFDAKVSEVVPLTPDEEALCTHVLNTMATIIKKRRLNMFGSWEDFDRIHDGTITVNQFQSVLASYGLHFKNDEINTLAKKFAASPKHDGIERSLDRINYYSVDEVLTGLCNKMK